MTVSISSVELTKIQGGHIIIDIHFVQCFIVLCCFCELNNILSRLYIIVLVPPTDCLLVLCGRTWLT